MFVFCEGCLKTFDYRDQGFLCEGCAEEDHRLVRDTLTREIVERLRASDDPDVTSEVVADWIEGEYLTDKESSS